MHGMANTFCMAKLRSFASDLGKGAMAQTRSIEIAICQSSHQLEISPKYLIYSNLRSTRSLRACFATLVKADVAA